MTSARDRARERRRGSRLDPEGAVVEDNVVPLLNQRGSNPHRSSRVPPPGRKDQQGAKRHGGRGPGVVQVGQRWAEIKGLIDSGEMTWEEFCADLDPEELARGRLKDADGGWRGRPPAWVPRAFFLACQREIHNRFNEKLQARVLSALDEYIIMSRSVEDAATRERMLRYLMERVVGPIPKEVVVTTEKPWEVMVGKIISKGKPAAPGARSRYATHRGEADEQS